MKRILSYVLITVVASMSLVSCLYQEEDLFDKSSSLRMAETLVDIRNVLTGSSQGWVMYYYPNGGAGFNAGTQGIGGYVLTMTFTDSQVTAWNEKVPGSDTSLYKLTNDDGPVLAFDSFNNSLHYFATPSGSSSNLYGETGNYQAYKGDFEFLVLKHSPEEIILKGKRSLNYYKMYPLTVSPEEYVSQTVETSELVFMSSFDGLFNGQPAHITLDLNARQATITLNGDEENAKTVAYNFTPEGIRFYEDVKMGGNTFSSFKFDRDKATLISTEYPDFVLQGSLPEGWSSYSSFLGTWTLNLNNGETLTGVQLKENVAGKSILIGGLHDKFDVFAEYDLGTGTISIQTQHVAEDPETGYYVLLGCRSIATGYYSFSQTYGMKGVLSTTGGVQTITLSDNGKWARGTDSFGLYFLSRRSFSTSDRVGYVTADWFWKNGDHTLKYITSLVRQ
ncbi:MAG: DUF4302 domain-containing protein [Bacteroidales bacterium]|nr:DUF4302 domain-containing protein [Bacteroidales bacterium]